MGIKSYLQKSASHFLSRISGGRFSFYQEKINGVGFDDYVFGEDRRDFIEKGYGRNPYTFMVIDRIVQRAIDIKWDIVDENGEEVKSVDPFFNSIIKEPNQEGWKSTLYRMLANELANELFIIEKSTLGMDKMTGFIVPNSQNVLINTNTSGVIISYDVSFFDKTFSVEPEKVLHIKRPDITSDLHNGLSTLQSGRIVYESNNEVWRSEAALHKNKGVAGVLYEDGNRPSTPTEYKALQDKFDGESTGVNFGKVKVSKIKLGYIPMGMNPSDLKSIETRIDHLRSMCALYSADPRLFGDVVASTYNNMRESKAGLIIDAVIPLLERVLPQLITWINDKTGNNYSLRIDIDSIPEMQIFKDLMSARIGREVAQGILPKKRALEILYPQFAEETEGVISNVDVTGLIQLTQGVNDESISREAAIVILMNAYGFEESTANEILG